MNDLYIAAPRGEKFGHSVVISDQLPLCRSLIKIKILLFNIVLTNPIHKPSIRFSRLAFKNSS